MYNSLFDKTSEIFVDTKIDLMYFNDNFNQVFENLESLITSFNSSNNKETVKLLLNSSYLIRGLLDYKYKNPENLDLNLLNDSIEINLDIYSSNFDLIKSKLYNLKRKLDDDELLEYNITNSYDSITWISYHPRYTQKTLNNILISNSNNKNKDILFISLANGGIPVGLDLYLKYVDSTKSKNSYFYPVLFSHNKRNMQEPFLTKYEEENLIKIAKNKQIIIFDEDITTGFTMDLATDYFYLIFQDPLIKSYVNINVMPKC